ncbi:hypothetical protein CBR_g37122 [Chara braunii]|uniref:Uncharacterized protein n=1 Tax=Chara braunii TaxID=69332 RepID=A0A388LM65_CHABU|nr:hypothetical protein CBR_g37122 [Chara braunii]|eukprot:GBG83408.1 hypothetical protein CBR_g37122 [Chara braunii]
MLSVKVLVGSLIFSKAPFTAARSYLRGLRSLTSFCTSDTNFSTLPSSSAAFCPAPLVPACVFGTCAFSACFVLDNSTLSALSMIDLSSDAVTGSFAFCSSGATSDLFVLPSFLSGCNDFLSAGFMTCIWLCLLLLSFALPWVPSLSLSSDERLVDDVCFRQRGEANCATLLLPKDLRQKMATAMKGGFAITAAKVQVLLRNRDEVDAFQELVEGYGLYLGLATEAADRVCVLEKKLVQVQDDRDTVAAVLQRTERTIQRSPDIDALEAKVAALQQDLGQSYKASAEVSQQLVQASSLAQSLREELEEKKKVVVNLQESRAVADAKVDYLEGALKEKTNAVELASMEAEAAVRERIEVEEKLRIAEAENRSFVDKLMEFKLKEAEKINELNAMYEDMVKQFQRTQLQVGVGVWVCMRLCASACDASLPVRKCRSVWVFGCACGCVRARAMLLCLFANAVKAPICTFQIRNPEEAKRGYGIQTILTHSNCNALCLTPDGAMICTGHTDGHLRFWEMKNGVLVNEVPAHSRAITSVSVSQGGTSILTNGRDNVLNVFDLRTFEARCTLRAPGYLAPSNWSRACMSPDDKYIAAGSSDSNVYVWSHTTASLERVLRGHASPVFSCAWCDLGRPLVSCDKNGFLLVWE